MTVYNKLVRDRIPEIITSTGRTPVVQVLDAAATRVALLEKLGEEAAELRAADGELVVEELADLLEVVLALAKEYQVPWSSVIAAADRKRDERGGFVQRQYLIEVSSQPRPSAAP